MTPNDTALPKSRLIVNLLGATQNTDNYGVRVLLSAAVDALVETEKNVQVQLLDYGREDAIWCETSRTGGPINLSLINLRFTWKPHLPNNIVWVLAAALAGRILPSIELRQKFWDGNLWLRRIRRAKTNLSLAGGDSFGDTYGLGRFFYVALPQLLIVILGHRLVLLPQTYGPFNNPLSRTLARIVFRHATRIYSRDREGVAVVCSLLGRHDSKVQFAPDLGFGMVSAPIDNDTALQLRDMKKRGVLVGLNVSSLLHMGGYTRENMFGLRDSYPELIRELLEYLVRETQVQILLVPHVYGGPQSEECELKLCRHLLPEFDQLYPGRVSFIDQHFSHRQVKTIIGYCDMFLGSRMHACVAAVSQGVPTVCLAYSDKFRGVMHSVSPDICVVDLRTTSVNEMIEEVRKVFERRSSVRRKLAGRFAGIRSSSAALFGSIDVLGS